MYHGSGSTTLIMSNQEMNDIKKIFKADKVNQAVNQSSVILL